MKKMRIERWKWILTLLMLFLLMTIITATMIGSMGPIGAKQPDKISFRAVFHILTSKSEQSPEGYKSIILDMRLPRVLLAALVGCALAVAGTTMQGIFRNPMADPFIVGISSGASVGAASSLFLGIRTQYSLPLCAFAGASLSVFVVYNIAHISGRVRTEQLLLSGIAVGSFLSAITSFLIYIAGKQFHFLIFWLLGGLYTASWSSVNMACVPIVLGTLGILLFSRHLNVLLLGDEPALHLGVDVETVRKILLVLTALITGVAVAFSGIIGFVGLITPHMTRILVGPNHRMLLPLSGIGGALFLIWADTLARTVISPTEIPVGVITSLCGAPFFVYLLRKSMRGGVHVA